MIYSSKSKQLYAVLMVLILSVIGIGTNLIYAQDLPPSKPKWISISIGPSTYGAISSGFTLNHGRRKVLQLALNRDEEYTWNGVVPSSVNSIGINYGLGFGSSENHPTTVLLIGPAYIWGLDPFNFKRGKPYRRPYSSIGLVINVQLIFFKHFGVDIYRNYNSIKSVTGFRLSFIGFKKNKERG